MCLPLKSSKFSGNIIERYLEQGSFIFAVGAGFVTYITSSFSFFLQVEKGLKRTATDFFAGGSGFETYRHVIFAGGSGFCKTATFFVCRWNRVWDVQQRFCYKEERSKLLSSSSVTR